MTHTIYILYVFPLFIKPSLFKETDTDVRSFPMRIVNSGKSTAFLSKPVGTKTDKSENIS